jgi:hypothetical protein
VVTIFCLFSVKALLSQAAYQRKVLHARRVALKQLKSNIEASKQLETQFNQVFEGSDPVNIIGGKNTKDTNVSPPDGDNARIVLDALPSKYDFPALITSIAKIVSADNIGQPSVSSTDESKTIDSKPAINPSPKMIQLNVSGTSSYTNVQNLIKDFERSIRPFDITNLQLGGNLSAMTVTAIANSYFQTAKSLDLQTEVIK